MNPHLEKARAAWGDEIPDWVITLAEECQKSSRKKVSQKIGYSDTVVTRLLSNSYTGDVERVGEKVRGIFMAVTVECPVLGSIRRDRCINEQGKKLTFENPLRPALHEACRNGCVHSRLGGGK